MNFCYIIILINIIISHENDVLFNSILGDNYNLTSIYSYNYDNIKIKHLTQNPKDKIICVLGVLVNQIGIIIEKEMLDWLMPEYDVYCVYQKSPGILYEYPAIKFAQWVLEKLNKSLALYLHTKGSSNVNLFQQFIRNFWKIEFKSPRNKIYIKPILNNQTDVSAPFINNRITWYNGMFISKRAFDIIGEVPKFINRYRYEYDLFNNTDIRIIGIIKDNQPGQALANEMGKYLNKINSTNDFNKKFIFLCLIVIIKFITKKRFFSKLSILKIKKYCFKNTTKTK
jgi:hypothetical protein